MYLGNRQCAECSPGLGINPLIVPGVQAAGALTLPLFQIFGGKKHYSPWGFLYDEYYDKIYQNEQNIAALKKAIGELTGVAPVFPETPWPPTYVSAKANLQAAQKVAVPIVSQYTANTNCVYDKHQVEPGGCYEESYGKQLGLIKSLESELQAARTQAQLRASVPSPGSATAPMPQGVPQPVQTAPGNVQYPGIFTQPAAPVSPSPFGPSISITTPGSAPVMQADIMGMAGGAFPYIVGGIGLLLLLAFQQDKKDRRTYSPRTLRTPLLRQKGR